MRTKATKTEKNQNKAVGFIDFQINDRGKVRQIKTVPFSRLVVERHVACCPLVSNIGGWDEVRARHPDWELSQCPSCSEQIYLSTEAVAMIRDGMRYACTACALKNRDGGTLEDLERIRRRGNG